MTQPCHLDHDLGTRVTTNRHDVDCTDDRCLGCQPCTERHCVVDGRRHLDRFHPLTCPDYISAVRSDLDEVRWLCRHLRWQASRGENLRAASGVVLGGDAMVLIGPHARHTDPDMRHDDPTVPLDVLASWDWQVRTWLGHTGTRLSSITGTSRYLADQLHRWAQDTTGQAPDWLAFSRAIGDLRRLLERTMHDEQADQQGVPFFECGERLVRRWGKPNPCQHQTSARATLALWEGRLRYPEALTPADRAAALLPCGACDQGGIADPSAGQSWECPGCRKAYTPGEYASAVRRDLLTNGPDRDGWTHISMASEAATTMTGVPIPATTVRKWAERLQVASVCRWTRGLSGGQKLVAWADVADQAAAAARRAEDRIRERAARERDSRRLLEQVQMRGMSVREAAALGMHINRARAPADEWPDGENGAA